MNFKSVKKTISKFVLAMLLSSSFSLNASAIGSEQQQIIENWLTIMNLDVKQGKEILKYTPFIIKNCETVYGKTPCYLVPIYKDKIVEEFFIDLYSNPDYKEHMCDFCDFSGHKGIMTPELAKEKYEKALISMYDSGKPEVYGHEYLDGLPGSLEFLIYYGDDLAGHLSIGPMRLEKPLTTTNHLKENPNDISKVSVVINKKYSGNGMFWGLREVTFNFKRFLINAYRTNDKNERHNLNMLYAAISKNQSSRFTDHRLECLLGFKPDSSITSFFAKPNYNFYLTTV